MDQGTLRYYNLNAAALYQRYAQSPSPFATLFPWHLPGQSRVLDIGCASGRDMAEMERQGHQAWGIEPSPQLREETCRRRPDLAPRILPGGLPQDLPPFGSEGLPPNFDAILLSAVIMHIHEEELFSSLLAVRQLLTPQGRLIISFPVSRPPEDTDRLMILRPAERIELLLQRLGFTPEASYSSADVQGRSEITWTTLVHTYSPEAASKELNRIEDIINRDRKTATYKLALLRGICDTATLAPGKAEWTQEGKIRIPLAHIAEKWVEYYWPLVNTQGSFHIPQSTSDTPGSQKPLAFRRLLLELGQNYRQAQEDPLTALSVFLHEKESKRLSPETGDLYDELLQKMSWTIKKGPVFYTGGGQSPNKPFSVVKEEGTEYLLLDKALWREMVLLGHWISDSIILHWSTLTRDLAQAKGTPISAGRVLDLLTLDPVYQRDVLRARQVYSQVSGLDCVWSGKALTNQNLAIDHAIPFSLRHDNALWNLLPSDDRVNNSKSDKIPELPVLQSSRDGIVQSWQLLNRELPPLFQEAYRRLMGKELRDNWEKALFKAFTEAMETTAVRCGAERWPGAVRG